MILVTGAKGHFGSLAIDFYLQRCLTKSNFSDGKKRRKEAT
jgi:hypothetical protein